MMSMVVVTTPPCMMCNTTSELLVSSMAYEAWRNGMFIQEAFPDWTPEDRELLLTGTHATCWDNMFPDEDE